MPRKKAIIELESEQTELKPKTRKPKITKKNENEITKENLESVKESKSLELSTKKSGVEKYQENPEKSFQILVLSFFTIIVLFLIGAGSILFYSLNKEKTVLKNDVTELRQDRTNLESKIDTLQSSITSLANAQPAQPEPLPTTLEIDKPNYQKDHWQGPVGARFVWVEYADYQCPFCAQIQPSLKKLVANNPEIAWVYRNYPLTSLHPNALKYAEAAECIAGKNGNEAFWKFTDRMYEQQATNSVEKLPTLADTLGLDGKSLKTCLDSGVYSAKVLADSATANAILGSKGFGTPTGVIYDLQTNKNLVVSGALPYEDLDRALKGFIQSQSSK